MNKSELLESIGEIDWEFTGSDTQYLTHNIHRYSGKFIPQIASTVIELISKPDDLVLDSYMGSGTTLLEAQLLGRNSIGTDLNPLAVLISNVKNMNVKKRDIAEIHEKLVPFVKSLVNNGQMSFVETLPELPKYQAYFSNNQWRLSDSWNQKWYGTEVLKQLVSIFSCIESLDSPYARDIATVAFSDILRKSSNASSRYPNVMFDKNSKPKPLPAKPFLDALCYSLRALDELSVKLEHSKVYAKALLCNNLELPLETESIDAIVTHPPYIAAVPYAEYGCLSLNWLGHDIKALDAELTGGKRQSSLVVDRFTVDYERYFAESFRVLKTGSYMFLMVGNPTARGKKIMLNQMTIELAEIAGFSHIATVIRQGQNRRGNRMGSEYLIFFQKQNN